MKHLKLINPIFFDTDCISSFLWVNESYIIESLFENRIFIPNEVYVELNNPTISHLKQRIDTLISNHKAQVISFDITSELYLMYRALTTYSKKYPLVIGKGEASAIVLSKYYNGILASNNLKDIQYFVNLFSLRHITTGDILVQAFYKKLISEAQGNSIWTSMLSKKRKLGSKSFTEYLRKTKKI